MTDWDALIICVSDPHFYCVSDSPLYCLSSTLSYCFVMMFTVNDDFVWYIISSSDWLVGDHPSFSCVLIAFIASFVPAWCGK